MHLTSSAPPAQCRLQQTPCTAPRTRCRPVPVLGQQGTCEGAPHCHPQGCPPQAPLARRLCPEAARPRPQDRRTRRVRLPGRLPYARTAPVNPPAPAMREMPACISPRSARYTVISRPLCAHVRLANEFSRGLNVGPRMDSSASLPSARRASALTLFCPCIPRQATQPSLLPKRTRSVYVEYATRSNTPGRPHPPTCELVQLPIFCRVAVTPLPVSSTQPRAWPG